jgi:hypothetical protein
MSYLIDASNLGGVLGGGRGARDPESVVKFVLAWARSRGKPGRMKVVFDGAANARVASSYGNLEVVFGEGKSADDVIRTEVARAPRMWTVVTDDAALARACRDLGAKVVAAKTLAAKVIAGPHPSARRAPLQVGPTGQKKAGRAGKALLSPYPDSSSTVRLGEKPQSSAADAAHWKKVFDPDPE